MSLKLKRSMVAIHLLIMAFSCMSGLLSIPLM
jgi:hypothetical protein